MAELLLELFSEEIPARMQADAAEQLRERFLVQMQKAAVAVGEVKTYVTPRRLTLVAEGLPQNLPGSEEERRGPRVGAPEAAVEGFARSAGVEMAQLERRAVDKGEFYFAVIRQAERSVSDVLQQAIQEVLTGFSWPKSMRWGNHSIRWVRPLHHILCLFNGEVLPVRFGHLEGQGTTRGHRFMANRELQVKNFKDYQKKLEETHVVLDREARKARILESAEKQVSAYGLTIKSDEGLLEEVAGLVEWPVVLIGKIEPRFMHLPQEVLVTAMRMHQKYFSTLDKQGKLAPYFITVSNVEPGEDTHIIEGNQRVLRARLEDARFFWDQDRRTGLESRLPNLEHIVFHARLGTVAEKMERTKELAKLLAVWVPHASLTLVERAAMLAKADLTTEMVGEFPELQGLMGSYYATESKEDPQVATAIREHYSPLGPNDTCPSNPVSIVVALTDKVDTLAGMFAAGEKPTGSKDPFALRRAALGIIRLILENNLRVPLRLLFEKALAKFPKSAFVAQEEEKPRLLRRTVRKRQHEALIDSLLLFVADRLKVALKGQEIRHDLIQAVFGAGEEDDLVRLVARVKALSIFLATEDGADLLAGYKRATNIVLAEEKKEDTSYDGEPKKDLLADREEEDLFNHLASIRPQVEKALKAEDDVAAMAAFANLRQPVDKFFDNVTVNCDNAAVRRNRLLLLSQFRRCLHQVADFSVIEIG